jgi:hypothetical protein
MRGEFRKQMSTVLANPAEMIVHGAPRRIHNDAELEAYTDALFHLTAQENPSASQAEAVEPVIGFGSRFLGLKLGWPGKSSDCCRHSRRPAIGFITHHVKETREASVSQMRSRSRSLTQPKLTYSCSSLNPSRIELSRKLQ